jgi:alkyl sulfatase BDS1-like metallo-beta-lactamase superfamily hydrolase
MPTPLSTSPSTPLYRSRPGGFDIQPASRSEARPINDFIYLSEGLSNAFLVVTSEGRVVINTGMGFEAPVHKRNFDAVDPAPVRYILLTQGHVDHVGGVDLFRERGTEVVAQANNPAHQADDERIKVFRAARSAFAFADTIAKALRFIHQNLGGSVPPQSRPEPTLTFDDRHAFELGGIRFELISTPGGETTDSMVIWLPDHRICFTGNLFSALFGHFPNLVTIRGEPVEGKELIRSELLRLRGAVLYVHDETVRGMNEGKDVWRLMREIELPPELEVGEGYGKVSWSVRAIWETYAGWFHHRSTTELYPVPPSSVHPDLVKLAGGADAVVERAREKLEAGAAIEALHFLEIALAAAPAHRGALEVSIAAHERLEAESENFWLTSWIRKQISTLRAALEAE